MSIARLHTVDHARQVYEKVAKTDAEGNRVTVPVTSKRTGAQKFGRGGRPMVRRVTVHDRSKPLPMPKCGKCGDEIKVGGPYRWFTVGFRSHAKRIRCMKPACTPKMSERESSNLSTIMAAQEDASEQLNALDAATVETDDVETIVQGVGETVKEVADEYRQADESFGGGGNTPNGERADTLESSADTLESWRFEGDSEPERCDKDGDDDHDPDDCDDCKEKREEWGQELIDAGIEAVDNIDM